MAVRRLERVQRFGVAILIYWFMHAYFGVGSLRNAWTGSLPDAGMRVLAALYALSWLTLAVGGVLALLGRKAGLLLGRGGAAVAAAVNLMGIALPGISRSGDMHGLMFLCARPVADGYLSFLLSRSAPPDTGTGRNTALSAALAIAAGAILPWSAWALMRVMNSGPLTLSRELTVFPVLFMCLWSALPFSVPILASPGSGRRTVFGSLSGTALASLYVYGLVWAQQFNLFLLALLPPVVFAGQALGAGTALLLSRRKR